MTITIPDEILKRAGLTERDALVEFACYLFDTERLDLVDAGRLAGLSRVEIEKELRARKIAIYRPTVEDFEKDLKTLEEMGG